MNRPLNKNNITTNFGYTRDTLQQQQQQKQQQPQQPFGSRNSFVRDSSSAAREQQQPFSTRNNYNRDSASQARELLQQQQQLRRSVRPLSQSNPHVTDTDSRSCSLPPPEHRASTPQGEGTSSKCA